MTLFSVLTLRPPLVCSPPLFVLMHSVVHYFSAHLLHNTHTRRWSHAEEILEEQFKKRGRKKLKTDREGKMECENKKMMAVNFVGDCFAQQRLYKPHSFCVCAQRMKLRNFKGSQNQNSPSTVTKNYRK